MDGVVGVVEVASEMEVLVYREGEEGFTDQK